eukprot:gene33206-40177_t
MQVSCIFAILFVLFGQTLCFVSPPSRRWRSLPSFILHSDESIDDAVDYVKNELLKKLSLLAPHSSVANNITMQQLQQKQVLALNSLRSTADAEDASTDDITTTFSVPRSSQPSSAPQVFPSDKPRTQLFAAHSSPVLVVHGKGPLGSAVREMAAQVAQGPRGLSFYRFLDADQLSALSDADLKLRMQDVRTGVDQQLKLSRDRSRSQGDGRELALWGGSAGLRNETDGEGSDVDDNDDDEGDASGSDGGEEEVDDDGDDDDAEEQEDSEDDEDVDEDDAEGWGAGYDDQDEDNDEDDEDRDNDDDEEDDDDDDGRRGRVRGLPGSLLASSESADIMSLVYGADWAKPRSSLRRGRPGDDEHSDDQPEDDDDDLFVPANKGKRKAKGRARVEWLGGDDAVDSHLPPPLALQDQWALRDLVPQLPLQARPDLLGTGRSNQEEVTIHTICW